MLMEKKTGETFMSHFETILITPYKSSKIAYQI